MSLLEGVVGDYTVQAYGQISGVVQIQHCWIQIKHPIKGICIFSCWLTWKFIYKHATIFHPVNMKLYTFNQYIQGLVWETRQ